MFSVSFKHNISSQQHMDTYPKFADIPKEGDRFFMGGWGCVCEVLSTNVIFGNFVRVIYQTL